MNYNLVVEDPEIWALIVEERRRQEEGLELIASENFTSEAVMEAMGSILTNKYAEGYPSKRYYGGCEYIDKVEQLAIDRVKKLFGAEYANVQPHSGAQANLAVYQALIKPGDTILTMSLQNGAHLSHGSPANASGKLYNIVEYHTDDKGYIDYEDLKTQMFSCKPKIVLAGASAYPREIEFDRIYEIINEYEKEFGERPYYMVDMAHIAGLVAAGLHISPVPYADVVTSTTHKTLRGPRGGIILAKENLAKKISSAVFPGTQGGPLEHIIAAKAVAFKEALTPEFREYQRQLLDNCKTLASVLLDNGLDLITKGTDNHLILIDLRNVGLTGLEAQERLEEIGITTNKNAVPNDPQKPMITSGLRLGTAAVTTRGMGEEEMKKIGEIISFVLTNKEIDNFVKDKMRLEIKEMCNRFPIYE